MELTAGEVVIPRQQEECYEQCVPDELLMDLRTWLRAFGEVSILTDRDADEFLRRFQREETCYANSWSYLLRSTRTKGGLGYKFVGGDETIMGIGFRNNALYLVHPLGPGRFETTLEICRRMLSLVACPIILKKVDQRLCEYLFSTQLFRDPPDGWELLEEEAFPEHVLHLETLYAPGFRQNPRSSPLLRKVRRFETTPMRLSSTDLSSITEGQPGFSALFGSNPDKYGSYLPIIREAASLGGSEGRYQACAYSDQQGIVHGLYIAERLSGEKNMGLYCAVSSRGEPGITEWMDYHFFQQIYQGGTRRLYLGGSETPGVHAYVQKLLPFPPSYVMRSMEMVRHEAEEFPSDPWRYEGHTHVNEDGNASAGLERCLVGADTGEPTTHPGQ